MRRLTYLLLLFAAVGWGAETRKTLSECQTLLADNASGNISPQDLRDCLIATNMQHPVNAQTGTTYTVLASDRGKYVTLSNAASIAVTLPQAGTSGFEDGWWTYVEAIGAGTATITPTTSTINGSATLVLNTEQWAFIFSDGTNYQAFTGIEWPNAVSATEVGYLDSVTSAIQTQIDGKAASSHNHAAADVNSGTFADARVAQSNVTQHVAAIDHDSLLNFDANEHFLQSAITTLGTIGTGVWQGTAVANAYGGTGQNSSAWTGLAKIAAGVWSALTLGSGVETWMVTPSSANLATAVTGETGSGALVFGTLPNFTTGISVGASFAASGAVRLPNNNCIEFRNAANSADIGFCLNASDEFDFDAPINVGGTGGPITVTKAAVTEPAVGKANIGVNTSNALQWFGQGDALRTALYSGGALGTPSSGVGSNLTGIPISTGISGLGANVATFLGTPSSANFRTALTDPTGTGVAVFSTAPSMTSPIVSTSIVQGGGDAADSGFLRLDNASLITWESSPTGTDMTLGVNASEILDYSGTFNAVSVTEGGLAVPNSGNNLSFFSATTVAQLAGVLSDENFTPGSKSSAEGVLDFLLLGGGQMTGQIITDNLGIDFQESDSNPTCAAGNYTIFADLSETTLKKCLNGVVSDLDTGGAGSGDSIEVEDGDDGGSYATIDTTARFEDQGDINFVLTDGGAGGPDTVTALVRANAVALSTDTTGNYLASCTNGTGITGCPAAAEGAAATPAFDFTATLAGNPALGADESVFSTDGTGGGIIFEGAADAIEGLLVWNPTTADRTLTLPDATDTIVGRATTDTLTNKTLTTPTIGDFTNSTHNHTNAAGGGTLTLAGAAFANQGTTAQVLHGNAAGNPSWGQVDLTTTVTGVLPGANGGTGNGFFAVTGPTASLKTFTFPDSSATILYSGGALGTPSSGTGTNLTNIPIATGITGTTANLATALTDEDYEPGDAAALGSATATFTNKTLDAEGTGNSLTTVGYLTIPAAYCNEGTAFLGWDAPAGNGATAPTEACNDTGSIQRPTASFAGGAVNGFEFTFPLPADWTGNIDFTIRYVTTAATPTGNVEWDVSTVCRAVGESWDGTFNAAQTITDAVGSQNNLNDATQTTLTVTGCAADEDMTIRVERDGTNDTNNDAALMLWGRVKFRRAQ